MTKISWSCVVIGMISILLSISAIPFGYLNLPFQFVLASLNNSCLFGSAKFYNFFKNLQTCFHFADYIFSIILVISGIGTIWVKSWGKTFAYIYGVGIIFLSISGMPIALVGYIKEFFRISRGPSFMDWIIWGGALTYILTLLGALIYPVVLLIFFSRPKIKEKFATKR